MSAYLVNRDGQELGSFELSQIKAGLQTGQFEGTDLGWCEGMEDWKELTKIAGPAAVSPVKSIASTSNAPISNPARLKPVDVNPYAAPSATSIRAAADGAVPYEIIKELKGTKPWVRFISILMGIACVIFVLALVGMFFTSLNRESGAYAMGTAVGYGIFSVFIIYPTLKLSKYAANIGKLVESESFADLAAALTEQRRLWKFYGILAIIYLGFFATIFIGTFFLKGR